MEQQIYCTLDILIMVEIFNLKTKNLNVLYFCLYMLK